MWISLWELKSLVLILKDCLGTTWGNLQKKEDSFRGLWVLVQIITLQTFLVWSPLSLSQPLSIALKLWSNPTHKERRGLFIVVYGLPEVSGLGNTGASELPWDPAPGHKALEGMLNFSHLWISSAATVGEEWKFPGSTWGHLLWLTSLIPPRVPATQSCIHWLRVGSLCSWY